MFRRRRGEQADQPPAPEGAEDEALRTDDDVAEAGTAPDVTEATEATEAAPAPLRPRPDGPFDESEVTDDLVRLDLGSLRIPGAEGMELRVEVDQASGAPVAVTLVLAESAAQLQAFAAPRGEGLWDGIRADLRTQMSSSGVVVDEVTGPLGPELRTQVPAAMPDGSQGVQPARFTGIDGPRWFLRTVFLGRAAVDRSAAEPLEALVRACVVVRGGDPMSPGDLLALRLPEGAVPVGFQEEPPTAATE